MNRTISTVITKATAALLLFIGMLTLAGCTSDTIITGKFYDKTGVMDPISCFCFNGGYIETNQSKTPICFETEITTDCKTIKVTGNFKTKTNNPEPTNSCTVQTKNIFYAKSFECIN